MVLYHTSTIPVESPDTIHSRDYLDFGKGFYLTTIQEQAVRYGQRFLQRQREAWLNTYELDYSPNEWRELRFESYDKAWLRFIAACRAGNDKSEYDIVIGGIANDKVIRTLDRYFEGELSERQALGVLKFEKPNIQYCIRSQKMIDQCLKYINSTRL